MFVNLFAWCTAMNMKPDCEASPEHFVRATLCPHRRIRIAQE